MLVGLIGLKQVGKSTSAAYLSSFHHFARLNFKDGLVRELKENFPDLLNELRRFYQMQMPNTMITVNRLFQIKPPLIRMLMQNYGTEVRRREDPDYWVRVWENSYPDYPDLVVDDVRFKNEAEAIKSKGGILIRITRDDILPTDQHTSETENMSIEEDYCIHSSFEDYELLYKQLDEIINKHRHI